MSQTVHPLKHLLSAVRRRARLVLVVHAIAWVAAVVLAAGLALGLLDWALRSDDPLVRWLCCGVWWLGMAAAIYRFLYPAIAVRLSDVQLAQRVQRHWPELGDGLSSAVEFIDQSEDDLLAGSPDLRRTVIADAAARVERYRLPDAVDHRRPLWSVVTAIGLLGVVLVIFFLAPASAALAARRLLLPVSAESWPHANQLAFIDPPRQIASGDDFQVELLDENGQLPEDVEILFRALGDDRAEVERQPMEYDFARDRMVYRLTNVTQPFEYRAVGGDHHTMDWLPLKVVQPPRIESLRITLEPPKYTGWPRESSDRHIRALAGTRVAVRGVSTKPLLGAALIVDTPQAKTELPALLAEDGRTFSIPADAGAPWVIEQSGTYGFQLTDQQQFEQAGRSRWELRAIADHPPTISLDRPGTNTYVTADAIVRLKALVKDDLLVQSVALAFRRTADEDQPHQVVSLFQGPPQAPPSPQGPLTSGGPTGDSRSFDYEWDLAELDGVQPGDTIEYFLKATDYKPQENKGSVRRLSVISPDELAERIAQRQTFILGQLAEALTVQQDARSQTKALTIQLDEVGRLDPQDINHLQSAELNQRRVVQLLVDEREGIAVQIEDLLDDLTSNRVDSPSIRKRMEELLGEIRRVGRDHLPVIEQQLVLGIKSAQAAQRGSNVPSKETKSQLVTAGTHQDQVIDALERLRSQLAKWDSYRRFAREISQLRRAQQTLTDEVTQRRVALLARELRELSATDRAHLRRLAERQYETARRLERILSRMEQMQTQLADTDPLPAETIGDAVDVARRRAVAEQMRVAGHDVEENRLGQAAQSHQLIDEALAEMLDVLAGRRTHELSRLIRKLQEAETELGDAINETKGLVSKLQKAQQESATLPADERARRLERLTAEQQALQEKVERLARQLLRLQAQRAGQSACQAGDKLGTACQSGQGGDNKSALEQTQDALEDLEQAQRQLQQKRSQVEQDLLEEQFARLEQQVEALLEQQQSVLVETRRLRELQVQQGRLTRGQAESVRDLARQQRALADEALAFAESFAKAPVFHAALTGAANDMNRSAARLVRRLLDDTTERTQQEAIERLEDLLDALKPDEPEDNGEQPNGGGQGGGAGGGGGGGRVTSLVELKLLKTMQEDLYRRTVELHEARQRRGDALTEDLVAELTELAQEQGRLAELLLDLSEPIELAPEDDPENLPDVRDDLPLDLDAELEKSLPE